MAGDSVLAVFETAIGAVSAALAVQQELGARSSALAEDRRMRFRIGVHMGDVIEKADGTVYGEGVNIAARLQALSEPSGVTVSESIRTAVKGKVGASFEDLGEQTVKNIPEPVRAYRVCPEGTATAKPPKAAAKSLLSLTREDSPGVQPSVPARRRWWTAVFALMLVCAGAGWVLLQRADPPPQPLSVVVLPLRTEAGDATPSYLADAISDQLTTDLSRISGSFVIAHATASRYRDRAIDLRELGRQLGVRYAVEGSVHGQGEEIALDLRLVDTQDGHVAWSDRVLGSRTEIDQLRGDVVGRIARGLHLKLIDAEADRQRRHPVAHPDAYDMVMQAWSLWQRQDRRDNQHAQELLLRATSIDPASALAWSGLANTYISQLYIDPGATRASRIALAEEAALRAYQAEPHHVNALGSLATVRALQGREEEALALFDEQLRINPNYAPSWMWRAIVLLNLGQPEQAVIAAERAIRLSPTDPRLSYFYTVLARSLLHADRNAEAVAAAEKASSLPGAQAYAPLTLAAAAMRAGDEQRAREVVARFLAGQPGFTLAKLRSDEENWRPAYRARQEQLLAALRSAGVPER